MSTEQVIEDITTALVQTERENTALLATVDRQRAQIADYEQRLTEYAEAFTQLEHLYAQATYVLTGQGYAATEVAR